MQQRKHMNKASNDGKKRVAGCSASAASPSPLTMSKPVLYLIFVTVLLIFIYGCVLMAKNPVHLEDVDQKEAPKQPKASKSSHKATKSKHKPTSTKAPLSSKDEYNFQELSNYKSNLTIQDEWFHTDTQGLAVVELQAGEDRSTLLQRLMAASQRQPSISHAKSLLQSWPIFQWDLYKVAEEVNITLAECRLQPEPVFVLGSERDKGGMLGSTHDHPLMYMNVTMMEFVQSTFQSKLWLYWTGELSWFEKELGKKATVDHAFTANSTTEPAGQAETSAPIEPKKRAKEGWEYFRVLEDNFQKSSSNSSSNDEEDAYQGLWRPMLWLSHPGVVAQTHYDTQHNIFIQIQGVKRFHFFAPDQELYPYPNIHRSYRQSQIHFELPRNASLHSNFSKVQNNKYPSGINTTIGFEVMVYPGDVLYIPPYWSHRVESLTLSLSLSILSPSEIEAALAEIFWQQVPFGEFRVSQAAKVAAITHYFQLIFKYLPSTVWSGSMHDFMQELFETRFEPLLGKDRLSLDKERYCYTAGKDNNVTELVNKHNKLFVQCAQNVAGSLADIDYFNGVKLTFLKDYVEQLVRWAVGPDYTAKFLYHCL